MEDQNHIAAYLIAGAEITPDVCPLSFKKTCLRLSSMKLLNDVLPGLKSPAPHFSGSGEDLKEKTAFYGGGILLGIFKANDGKKHGLPTALATRAVTRRGTDIKRQELPYGNENLWTAIDHCQQQPESSTKTRAGLQDKTEAVNVRADEVDHLRPEQTDHHFCWRREGVHACVGGD